MYNESKFFNYYFRKMFTVNIFKTFKFKNLEKYEQN